MLLEKGKPGRTTLMRRLQKLQLYIAAEIVRNHIRNHTGPHTYILGFTNCDNELCTFIYGKFTSVKRYAVITNKSKVHLIFCFVSGRLDRPLSKCLCYIHICFKV